jgi:hypothetical protein
METLNERICATLDLFEVGFDLFVLFGSAQSVTSEAGRGIAQRTKETVHETLI